MINNLLQRAQGRRQGGRGIAPVGRHPRTRQSDRIRKVNSNQAKEVFADIFESGREPPRSPKKEASSRKTPCEIEGFCDQVIAANAEIVEQIKAATTRRSTSSKYRS
ncbi:MAG: hypothetical protein R3F11_02275 [Verrucomicrobiales bacterium]